MLLRKTILITLAVGCCGWFIGGCETRKQGAQASPPVLFLPQGATVTFDVSSSRIPLAQRVGVPVWTGPDGVAVTGRTCHVVFPVASRSRSDFKTLLLNWGSVETNRVLVYQLTPQLRPLSQFSPDRDQEHFGIGELVTLSFTTAPPVSVEEIGGLRWMVEEGSISLWAGADDGVAMTVAFNETGAVKLVILGGLCRGCSVPNSSVRFRRANTVGLPYFGALISDPQPGRARRVRLDAYDNFPYTNELARITALTESGDLTGLEALAREFKATAASNTNRYLDLVGLIVGTLGTYEMNLARQFELEQALARELLAWPGLLLGRRVGMLEQLRSDLPAEIASPAWPTVRQQKSEQFCRAWMECYAAVDWKYDPADPTNSVWWDSSMGGFSDPAAQARKRAAQVENERRAKVRDQYEEAQSRLGILAPMAERYLIRAYSKPPVAPAELNNLLETYVADAKARARILTEVAKLRDR